MKCKVFRVAISVFLIICSLAGCSSEIVSEHINDPVALSGDLAYYAQMDKDMLKEQCEEKHIEVTGAVSSKGYTLFYIGSTYKDNIRFSCTFSSHSDVLDEIKNGDIITVHGVCTDVIGDHVYLEGCQLSNQIESSDTTDNTTETTETTNTTDNTTETTEATNPPHTHTYSAATCTRPKTCSCGATEGSAEGHSWNNATCLKPKTCSVCGMTSGLTAGHNFSGGKCTLCGKDDPDYVRVTMVWIPTNGGTKYHTHAGCSNMDNPEKVTQSEAESRGFTPCKRCH